MSPIAVSEHQNEYAITVPTYAHERRSAPIYAHIIVDEVAVLLNCYVYDTDIITVLDDKVVYMGVNADEGCAEDTVMAINTVCPGNGGALSSGVRLGDHLCLRCKRRRDQKHRS